MPLDEWQEQALEASMGERTDGKWASKFVGISAPRQNGKSQLIVARALAGILLFDEKMIIISAHETDTARTIWQRLLDVIEGNPTLEARVTGRMDAVGREYLAFGKGMDKQIIKLKARRKSGARGFSADCLLLDEAQILGKDEWGSIVPTMSARPNPQMWLFGTPPTESDNPFAFSRVRESSKLKKARHCWLEWAANPGDDYDDPEVWAKANPAYGVRISYEACADDRSAMDDEQFGRERLGIWDGANHVSLFEGTSWVDGKRDTRPDHLTVNALALAVSFDLAHSSIVAASEDEGDVWVKPLHYGPGTRGVVDRCVDLQDRFGVDVVIDGRGPGAVLIPHLEKAGVRLHIATTGDVLDAFANLETKVTEGQFFHLEAAELDAAAVGAVRRAVGDRSALGRKKSESDISPLEAASLAAWRAGIQPVTAVSAYEDRGLIVI